MECRRRRTSSVDRASEIKESEHKLRKKQPDNPVHYPKDSLFSSSSGYTNYRGLLNLCFIILVLSNVRVALENVLKYGILVDPVQLAALMFSVPYTWPVIALFVALNVFIVASLALERFILANRLMSNKKGAICAIVIVLTLLSLPPAVFMSDECNPVAASICCFTYSVLSLKLTSYHMVNFWCRRGEMNRARGRSNSIDSAPNGTAACKPNGSAHNAGNIAKVDLVAYPDNLTLSDMYYFVFAPTLCYELNFPRSGRIRKRFLLKRSLEIIFLLQLGLGLIQQWMVPTIKNSLEPLKGMSASHMLERLLKLAVPNHVIWVIFFYWFFHSVLNVLAELMHFSDREFYRDWWNSESVSYFWQNWNIPVHRWCVRHVYVPLLSQDRIPFNRFWASTVVFFLSAFFHEYLVSVPLNMFRMWAFTGMIMQLPLSFLVSKYLDNQFANIAVWISLIIGQPLCILMYYHDYYVIHMAKTVS